MKAAQFDTTTACMACENGLPDIVLETYDECPVCANAGTINPRQNTDNDQIVMATEIEERGPLLIVRRIGMSEEHLNTVYGPNTKTPPDGVSESIGNRMQDTTDLTPSEAVQRAEDFGLDEQATMLSDMTERLGL